MRFIGLSAVRPVVAAFLLAGASGAAHAQSCILDAIDRATPLLKLHFAEGRDVRNLMISDVVRRLPPIRALVGKGRFDVIELRGYIQKSEYRMRFIYAQIPDQCVLMGQEIIEVADPY